MDIAQVVQAHNAIRDARTQKRHAWEAEDAKLEEQQNRLRSFLLQFLNDNDLQSVKTDQGTFYRTLKIKPSAADWSAIQRWVVENDGFEIFEKRLKATFIKDYMEDHEGQLPPGVNVVSEYEVSVRRPNTSRSPEGEDNGN